MIADPSQTNNSFTFDVPGYKIIVIPTTANNILDMQNQDPTYLNPFLYTSSVSQSQLNQEQNYVSSANETSSGGSSVNTHQSINESFSNFSNLRD